MKHVTFADKSLLMDDDTAGALIRYAAALAANDSADSVEVRALGADGDDVVATLLLSDGASLMSETSTTSLPGPDNSTALKYMLEQTRRLESPRVAMVEEANGPTGIPDYEL